MESIDVKPKETTVRIQEPAHEGVDRPRMSTTLDPSTANDWNGGGGSGGGSKTLPVRMNSTRHDRQKKLGHRRVGTDGQVTYKKKPTSELMSAIQLGIGQSVGGLASKPGRDLLLQDFSLVESVFFPREGSNLTPAHHYSDFRFKTYAPIAFRYFRELFKIRPDDFLLSLCNEQLQELSNPGASGSIFYITQDDEFIIKTVQHKEAEFLQKLLPGYYMNLNQNPRTLLPKFYGLYCYQCGGKNIRFVVMNNLLPSSIPMHEKYDLKGSTYKRKASKHERAKKSPTFKDLDFVENNPESLMLEADTFNALIKTIERDCRVLQSFKIMDYSMLLGIHNLDAAERNRLESSCERDLEQQEDLADLVLYMSRARSVKQRLAKYSTAMEAIQAPSEPLELDDENIPPGGIPARNTRGERLLLYIGIIDILQSYRLKKKLEHAMKAMVHDGDSISVHRPGFYSQRFQVFFSANVFKKIPSLDTPTVKGPHMRFKKLVQLALKHSPSKRKSAGRQRSVSEDAKTRETADWPHTNSEAEAGAVGGRPDLLPDNATPPRHLLQGTTSEKEIKTWSTGSYSGDQHIHTEIQIEGASADDITMEPSMRAASLNSPVPSHTESTPTHTEYTEGTPSFTASSPSASSDLLDSTDRSMTGPVIDHEVCEEHIELQVTSSEIITSLNKLMKTEDEDSTDVAGGDSSLSITTYATADSTPQMTHL